MYESFYGLKVKPFSLLPDPAFLYLSKQHEMAITLLEYSLENQAGFCVITGKAGTGKTTLLRRLLNQIDEDISIGLITNTHHSFGELLRWILHAFDLEDSSNNRARQHQIFIDYLIGQYAKNRRTMLIIDEAQNMSAEALEELRMLSNINSEKDLLLQVILVGQPPLRDILQRPELEQFAQRVAVDFHLDSLNGNETRGYIRHRLLIAGGERELFTDDACEAVFIHSGGIPRLINLLCDLSLVYAYAGQAAVVTGELVEQVVSERQKHGALPVFTVLPESRVKSQMSSMDTRASTTTCSAQRAPVRKPVGEARHMSTAEEATAVLTARPEASGKDHAHAVRSAKTDERQKPQAISRAVTQTDGAKAMPLPEALSDGGSVWVASGMPISASQVKTPAVSADSVVGTEAIQKNAMSNTSVAASKSIVAESSLLASPDSKAEGLGSAVTHLMPKNGRSIWMVSHRAANEVAGTRRHLPMIAIIFLVSVASLAWFYFDRTDMTKAFLNKISSAHATATARTNEQKPVGVVPAGGQPSAVQPVSATASMQQELAKTADLKKFSDETAKVRQVELERDAILAISQAAAREREAMRVAAQARERALTTEHEAALARERERANQLTQAAEKAVRQARVAALAAEAKASESELFPSPSVKSEIAPAAKPMESGISTRNTVVETEDSEATSFTANPCKGPSARFLSTCE